jgi:hypothetical protein
MPTFLKRKKCTVYWYLLCRLLLITSTFCPSPLQGLLRSYKDCKEMASEFKGGKVREGADVAKYVCTLHTEADSYYLYRD